MYKWLIFTGSQSGYALYGFTSRLSHFSLKIYLFSLNVVIILQTLSFRFRLIILLLADSTRRIKMRNDNLQAQLLRFQNVIIFKVKEIRLAVSRSKALALFFGSVIMCLSASADYVVANGANINAASLVGQSGVLTINGTLTLSSDVTLAGITDVIINAPNGNIYWSNNSNLIFFCGN